MKLARRTLFAAAACTALLIAAVPAQAKPSHATLIQTFKFRVSCGAQLPELGGISCFSESIPSGELDGVVELHAAGPADAGERGDSPWRPAPYFKPLKKGRSWSRAGVTCKRKPSVLRCVNGDDHGFLISPHTFEIF